MRINGKPYGKTARELLQIKFEQRRDLLPNILPSRGSGQIIAAPFHGKTQFLMQLAVAVATPGGTFLGREPLHGPVVLILYELSADEAQDRLRRILGKNEPPDRLRIVTREENFPSRSAEPGLKALRTLCDRDKPVLVGIDCFTDWRPERRDSQWFVDDKLAMDELRKLGYECKTFFLLPHHGTRKKGRGPTSSAQGTDGLGAGGSVMLKLDWKVLTVEGNDVPNGKVPLRWDDQRLLWTLGEPIKAGAPNTKREGAKAFLRKMLANGPRLYRDIKKAIKELDICSLRTLNTAKAELRVITKGQGKDTTWELPRSEQKKPTLNIKSRNSARVDQ